MGYAHWSTMGWQPPPRDPDEPSKFLMKTPTWVTAHRATAGVTRIPVLFDHLVSGREQRSRHLDVHQPGGLCVDDDGKFGRLLHRQLARIRALQDAADIDADIAVQTRIIGSVAHQPAHF